MRPVKNLLREWYFVPLLFFIAGLAYLPHIDSFGYYRDDWYLMYSANALGGDVFQSIYASDRPARSLVMSAVYSLFGITPLYYNISAFVMRVLGALSFLWTLRMIWGRSRTAMLFASILFLIYPGFLSMPNSIDYQSQQIALFFAHLSIAFSVRAVLTERRAARYALWISSILLTWFYLSLVEYFLGLEVFRLAILGVLAGRQAGNSVQRWIKGIFIRWLPVVAGPVGFVIWRFFIFESERKATDFGAQIRYFIENPLRVGSYWMLDLLGDTFESLVLSWGLPLANFLGMHLRLREILFASVLGMLSILVVIFIISIEKNSALEEDTRWEMGAFWVGLIGVVAGFIPVILSNRNADFYNLTRYMLASSSGAAIVLAVFVHQLRSQKLQHIILCLVIGVSILTHYLNGLQWEQASKGMRDFWWQVYWRAPQIEPGTTLVVNYSHTGIEEDYFVWGPANFIYYPESVDPHAVHPSLGALLLNKDSLIELQTRSDRVSIYRRSIFTYIDYDNILILTQPSLDSCVHTVDGSNPVVSEFDQYDIWLSASASNIKLIRTEQPVPLPDEVVFGLEPDHGWCYYYQKASLAYQQGDWAAVVEQGNKARRSRLSASDPVEWVPFLHAAIMLADRDEILWLAPRIKKSQFITRQVCTSIERMSGLDAEIERFAQNAFCANGD